MIKMISLVFIIFLLYNCSPHLKEGEVYEKNFIEAHRRTVNIVVLIKSGNSFITNNIPVTYYYPDAYEIKYKKYNLFEEKWIYQEIYTTEDIFKSINIGDWYKICDEDCFEQPKIKEE